MYSFSFLLIMRYRVPIPYLYVVLMACLLGLPACDPPAADEARAPDRPNILFAIADDVSFPHMGAYGTDWVSTPAFDRVAREGLLFTRAYTPNAKCAPSRSAILTGRNSWQLEEAANHWPYFPAKFKTYVEAMRENGYFAGYTAKGWGPGVALDEEGQRREMTGMAFNEHTLEPPAAYISSNDYAENFRAFLDARPAEDPFLFWYGSLEPHRAYEFRAGVDKGGKSLDEIDEVPGFWPDIDSVRIDMLDYAFEIEHFDRHLMRMIELLDERGELDNTLIVVTSDNGMPFPRVKGQGYEMANHMPLAIMWPAGILDPGRTIADLVSFIDFAPTFFDVAGIDPATAGMQPMQGRSIMPLLTELDTPPHRDHVLIGKERHDIGRPQDVGYPIRGIVQDEYLYIHNYEPDRWPSGNPETGYLNCDGSPTKTACIRARTSEETRTYWDVSLGKRPAEELFNIAEDPYCLNNLAEMDQHADLKNRLRERMEAELIAQGDPRMSGNGEVFDQYDYADEKHQGFYEKYMSGEALDAGWVNESDFDERIEDE